MIMEIERACLIYITNSADADLTRTDGKAKTTRLDRTRRCLILLQAFRLKARRYACAAFRN
jgi:hypothetical protein